MPASTEQKVDFLLKKIGYSASKTGGVEGSSGTVDGTKKKPTEEAIPSPLIIPSTSIWADSSLIPATPPGSDTFPVKVYATASAFRLTVDSSVSESRSFIARSTYGNQSSSIDGNWIDSQFGADYAVRVFKGDPNSGGVELPQAGATGNDTWFFDYSSGILNFNGTDNHASLGVTDTNIYILGYRYTGGVGVKPPIGIGTFDSLNVTGIATFHKDVEFIGAGNAGIKSAYWDQSASSLKFLDDVKAQFGDSQDLSIYHFSGGQGSNYISGANSKPIAITAQKVELLNQGHSAYFFKADADGTILYNNGAHKLVTTGYGVTVTGLESVGISTFNGAVIINDKLTINPDDASTTWQRELDTIHQIRDDIYLESTLNVGDKAGFDFTPLGITTFSYSGTTLTVGVTTTHALAAGKNILIKDSASGFSEAFNTIAGTTGTTVKVTRGSDPSSSLSIANTKVTVYTPTDPRGCVNVAKDYAKFNENSFNPILRGFVGIATTSAAAPSTEVFKIELKKDASAADHVATLLHSTREFGAGQRIALTIDDGNSYPDGKNLVLTQNGVKITADDSAFTDSDELLEVEGNAKIDGNLNVTGISTFQDDVTFQTANTNNLVLDKSDNSLKFGDSVKAKFGALSTGDLAIYHNGTNSHVRNYTGELVLNGSLIRLASHQGTPENYLTATANGAVDLYHNDIKRLSTSGVGVTVYDQLDVGNIGISTGLISGPATMYIDPATVGDNTGLLIVKGNLQVDGTQTTVNSTTMDVADKNVGIASGAANDAAADGAGLTVYSGDGNKTWNWVDATDSWTSSEHIRIPDDKVFGFATDTNTYIGRPTADTIAFTHGGGEKVRITSTGQVAIGTTIPGDSGADDLTIATSTNTGITVRSGTTSKGSIYFSDTTAANAQSYVGYIQYNHGDNSLTLATNASQKVRIDSSGNTNIVGILTAQYLKAYDATQNVIIGWEQSARNVTGSWNVLLGRRAGEGLTSGGNAVCIGANAGQLLGSASGIFIGGQAGSKVTGGNNLFIGGNAGQQTTSAAACTIIGHLAGIDNQGSNNTIVGFYAGRGNSGVTDGAQNTFIGSASGFKIRGGDDNTAVGYNSLYELLGGNKNVAIGRQAGDALVSGNNNIIIGYQADASTSTTSNEITLGDANITKFRIPGIGVTLTDGIITIPTPVIDIDGDVTVQGNFKVVGVSTFSDDVTFETANSKNIVFDKSDNALEFGDNVKANFGDSADLQLYHSGSNSNVYHTGTGNLNILTSNLSGNISLVVGGSNEVMLRATPNAAVELFYNNVERFETTNTGINVIGLTETDTLTTGNATLTGSVSAGSTTGIDGYYLKSTGIGVTWAVLPSSRTGLTTTATAGQTSFNFSYNVGFVDVFLNGVKLPSSEFTASNGSTIVLDDAAFANDTLEFISLNTVPVTSTGTLGGLTDVNITSPVAGQALRFNGVKFVNDYHPHLTTTSTSQVSITNLPIASYRSAEYTVQITEGTKYHVTKILAIHDGTNVTFNEYGTLTTHSSLATFTLDINSGSMRLLATPASTNSTTFKVKFDAITV